jgi:hypothetical protein
MYWEGPQLLQVGCIHSKHHYYLYYHYHYQQQQQKQYCTALHTCSRVIFEVSASKSASAWLIATLTASNSATMSLFEIAEG